MNNTQTIGAVVGRYQVPELHAGQKKTIDTAAAENDKLVIFIGYNDVRMMPRDELPVGVRMVMVQQAYPDAIVLPLPDSKISNEHWSQQLDQILDGVSGGGVVTLYGSRDSFIPYYSGRYRTCEVPEVTGLSGTALREVLNTESITTTAERRGWIAAIRSQYPVTDSVVDIAIVSPDWKKVLLGRRGEGALLRFFGGFLDAADASDAVAARREQTEEVVGIEVSEPQLIDSVRIDDPRYRKNDKGWGVMTRFHVSVYQSGEPKGSDDIELVEWVPLNESLRDSLVEPHYVLLDLLLKKKQHMLA